MSNEAAARAGSALPSKSAEPRSAAALLMSEEQLQNAVVQLARVLHFHVYHTHDSRKSDPGYTDLTVANGRILIFAELKSDKGRVKAEQERWLAALGVAGMVRTYFWRPIDWRNGTIERVLREAAAA